MRNEAPVRDLLAHYIGGGWGSDTPDDHSSPVHVIRGADFPAVSAGSMAGVPLRHEATKKIVSRAVRPGDIVLEISGGTKERPTGRTVFITRRLLEQVSEPVIPASFCRLVRPDPDAVEPGYLYFWLQDMYTQGRTWRYQVQSTGLANFQMEMFLDAEVVSLPPLDEQRRIAAVLGALDDLIEVERRQAGLLSELWRAKVASALGPGAELVPLSGLASFVNGKNFTKDASGRGLPVIRTPEVRSGPTASTVRSEVDAASANIAEPGDVLFVWSGSLMASRWKWDRGLVNQHIFKVIPSTDVPGWLVMFAVEELMQHFLDIAADKATTMGHIKRGDLNGPVAIPAREAWAALDEVVSPLWDDALAAEMHAADLTRARDELLPLLMSGRVRVADLKGVA